jgi:AraC-like DNA-binding protein
MATKNIFHIKSVSQFFEAIHWQKPTHPLIGVIDVSKIDFSNADQIKNSKIVADLYSIVLKDGTCGMQYGRNKYDFEEGVLQFMAPNQIVTTEDSFSQSTYGFFLVFHPDLIRNFDLGKKIKQYSFFNYSVYEALHLSQKEEQTLIAIVENITSELTKNIDKHSLEILVSNIQLLLNYSQRFYERQFITRSNSSSDIVTKLEEMIHHYYDEKLQLKLGPPAAEYFASKANYSTNYLSDLLKKETGKSVKDHIDDYVIDLAKTALGSSSKTINEVAFDLGFNYPHYFSRLFKKKTGETPREFRMHYLN